MNLLDRYLFKSVLYTCLAAVGLFAFLMLSVNALKDLLGFVLAGQLAMATFVRLILLLIPFVISYALPMGMLTGVLLTMGRLSADSEITAMRGAGIGLFRIARPVIFLGLIGAAAGLYANFSSMPWARVEYDKELAQAVQANPVSLLVPKTFIRNFPGLVVYVGERRGGELKDVWVWQLDKQSRVTRFIRAESGKVSYDKETSDVNLTLFNGKPESLNEKSPEDFSDSTLVGGKFDEMEPISLNVGQYFGHAQGRQKLTWMTYSELKAQEAKVASEPLGPDGEKGRDRDLMKVKLVMQDKLTMGIAVFAFAMVAVPLGMRVSRKETSANLGIAVLLFLSYYLLTTMVGWLDRHPEYRPDLLYWVPNLVFLGLAAWLFRRTQNA